MKDKFKVTVVFPCDFEDDESKRKKKYDKSYLYKFLEVKPYRYSSPIFSVNQNIPKGTESSKSKMDAANEILGSCHLLKENPNLFRDRFEVSNVFYPYGVCIGAELNKEDLKEFVVRIEKDFSPFKKEKAVEERADDVVWIVYEKPIIIVELKNEDDISKLPEEFMLEKLRHINCVPKIQVSAANDIVAIKFADNEDTLRNSLYSVLAVLISLKKLSSDVRTKSKNLAGNYGASDIEKRDTVMKIHQNCAVFEDIANKNIYYSKTEQELFEFLKVPLCLEQQERQIHSARDNADYLIDQFANKKTDRINTTVFITGYIGLILSFFALVPIQLRNIITTSQPLCTWQKVTLCAALVGIVVVICYALVSMYDRWEGTKSDFKRFLDLLKGINKSKVCSLISALIILLLIFAFVIFCVFVFSGMFDCV